MTKLLYAHVASPIGEIALIVEGERLCGLNFADCEQRMMPQLKRRYQEIHFTQASNPYGIGTLIQRYFEGDYAALDAIPISAGGTAFQQQVWSALRAIPPGTTMTYSGLASQIGKANAYRAVGAANALNPISIVLPCHRLLGANASLTGYGGGLERKSWLLRHEGWRGNAGQQGRQRNQTTPAQPVSAKGQARSV